MLGIMGRPREHDDQTAVALLDAAEQLIEKEGAASLSLRRVAIEAGTTTRAVYSLFGSKDGLEVALGVRAFDRLGEAVKARPVTASPVDDLVDAGVESFRDFAIGHPALYQLAVQQQPTSLRLAEEFCAAASRALVELHGKVARLEQAGLIAGRSVQRAACEFHAMCEGLAALELRGGLMFPTGEGKEIWRGALGALVAGLAVPASNTS
jgi:AcrR family transcriptional regulator